MNETKEIEEMNVATQEKTLEYYISLPYEVVIKHDEDGFFARVPELPGCMTYADTFEELLPMIEDAKRGYIEDALEHGDKVPEPRDLTDYSGKVNLRMPKTLHRDLARMAEDEGVSLNQVMVAALARAVGSAPTTGGTGGIAPGALSTLRSWMEEGLTEDEIRERRAAAEIFADVIERSVHGTTKQAAENAQIATDQAAENAREAAGRVADFGDEGAVGQVADDPPGGGIGQVFERQPQEEADPKGE